MRTMSIIGLLLVSLLAVSPAFAQERFFTLSGGTTGDSGNAKLEAKTDELKARQDVDEGCGAGGMLNGVSSTGADHGAVNADGCITSLTIDGGGNTALSGNLSIGGAISGGGLTANAFKLPGACAAGQVLNWNGTAWTCAAEADPQVGTLTSTKWCTSDGTTINCSADAPLTAGAETDPTVEDFAKTAITNLSASSCAVGNVLTFDGTQLTCVADIGSSGSAILLNDLGDVSIAAPAIGDILTWGGSSWGAAAEGDPTVEAYAKTAITGLSGGACAAGYVVSFNGTQLTCVVDAGGVAGGLALKDLSDVSSTMTPVDGDFLTYEASTTSWINGTETDPTVEAFAKTPVIGVSGTACDTGDVLSYDGTQLACVADAGSAGNAISVSELAEVAAATPVANDVISFNGTSWTIGAESDASVEAFAKAALPTCGAGEILTGDGTSLSCVADAGGSGSSIALNSLSDASITTPALGEMLEFDGTNWVNATGVKAFSKATLPTCAAGTVLKSDGTSFSCVADAGGSGSALNIKDLADVSTTMIPTDGQVLTYDNAASLWKATTNGVGTAILSDLSDVSTTAPTEGQSLVWDNTASEWKASTIVTVPNATKSMTAGWPDVISCNVTNPNWSIESKFYQILAPYSDGLYYYRFFDKSSFYDINFNADGTFNSYVGITTTDCNTTIAALYAAGQAFDLVGGDTTTLSTLTDVSLTGVPAGDSVLKFNAVSSKWEVGSASIVGNIGDLSDVSTTMTPTEGQSLVWDNTASEWKASTIVTVPNATKSMTAGWPDVIVCNMTNPASGDTSFYRTHMPSSGGTYVYRHIAGSVIYNVNFNADGTFNSYTGITTTNCNTTIVALYAAGQAFDLVGGDTTTLSTLTDVSLTGVPAGDSVLKFNATSSKWEVGTASIVGNIGDLSDVSSTMVPTGDQVLTWDALAGEWQASDAAPGVPNATKSMTAGWPDVIECNVTDPNVGVSHAYKGVNNHNVLSGHTYHLVGYSIGVLYNIRFNNDGTFNGYQGVVASDCNTTIAALYAGGKAFDLVGGDTTTLSTLTDVSITGTPTGGSAMIFNSSSSKWEVSQGLYEDATGKVGIATTTPVADLDVSGTIKVSGTGIDTCDGVTTGSIRFVSGALQVCTQD